MFLTTPHLPPLNAAPPRLPAPRRRPAIISSFVIRHSSFAFTLIELLVVIAIIGILAVVTMPAIRSLTKSNDQTQSTSLIRAMLSEARSIAISQHRIAGVVFFQETAAYSLPVHGNAVAMQLIMEDYNQNYPWIGPFNGSPTAFVYYSTSRQYLPEGIQVAMLSDNSTGINAAEQSGTTASAAQTRVILFDANGQLLLRNGLATQDPGPGGPPGSANQGIYPQAYGDWQFLTPAGNRYINTGGTISSVIGGDAYSSPGFFIYSRSEMNAQTFPDDNARASWIHNHSSVVIVNTNTGTVSVSK